MDSILPAYCYDDLGITVNLSFEFLYQFVKDSLSIELIILSCFLYLIPMVIFLCFPRYLFDWLLNCIILFFFFSVVGARGEETSLSLCTCAMSLIGRAC